MVLSLYGILQSVLLIVNGIAILNEDRLLRKYGWARNQISNFPGAIDDGFKMRALNLIYSVQTVMKIPLILMNSLVIAAELVF